MSVDTDHLRDLADSPSRSRERTTALYEAASEIEHLRTQCKKLETLLAQHCSLCRGLLEVGAGTWDDPKQDCPRCHMTRQIILEARALVDGFVHRDDRHNFLDWCNTWLNGGEIPVAMLVPSDDEHTPLTSETEVAEFLSDADTGSGAS